MIDFVAAAIGLFAIPSVLEGVERPARVMFTKTALHLRNLLPTRQDFRESIQNSAFIRVHPRLVSACRSEGSATTGRGRRLLTLRVPTK